MIESKEYKFESLSEAVDKLIEFKGILHKQRILNKISKYSLELNSNTDKTIIKISYE